ncbi:ATP-binding cassette domain-containing protein [Vibrio salinus]|uniref:ATP-binding cassette domain-containing protein n=1 Tax=Vibrio salinus TaxID=2899784 RepID=UPI0035616229
MQGYKWKIFRWHTGTYVLNDLNLSVHDGEMIALLGPSGCGKTTLFKCVMWLYSRNGW